MPAQTTNNKITSRIYGKKRGWVFTPSDFSDIGSMTVVRKILERLTKKGIIRRLARGLYDYPKFGILSIYSPPDFYEGVGKAIARKKKCRILPWGGKAANQLGLTLDVPARYFFVTNGFAKKVVVMGMPIVFLKTTPKRMAVTSEISGLVIQALKYLRKRNVRFQEMQQLRRILTPKEKEQILKDISCAPDWIAKVIKKVVTIDWRAY